MHRPSLLVTLLPALSLACSSGSSGSSTPLATNLGVSATNLRGNGDLWALEVLESEQGNTDLDGDGDSADRVLYVHHLADGSLRNLGLALGPSHSPAQPFVGAVLIAFGVSESAQGNTDLNGDGDTLDIVLHVYDDNTGTVTNTALAMAVREVAIGAGTVAFAVSEADQGGMDLDGSGSANGTVLHVYDSRTRVTTNAMRNVVSSLTFHDHAFAFATDEASAGADLNGDGDLTDTSVLQLYDFPLGGIVSIPLAYRGEPLAVGIDDWFLLADEAQEGRDENGDGDLLDGVYQRVEPHLGMVLPLGLSGLDSYHSTTDAFDLALVVQEIDGVDRNGDGDTDDSVPVLYDSLSDQARDSGVAIDPLGVLVFTTDWLAFAADESSLGLDLNGDGDAFDQVLHAMRRNSGVVLNLGEALFLMQPGTERVLFSQRESETGLDVNGDGDLGDTVLASWIPPSAGHPTGEIVSTGVACTGLALAQTGTELLLAVLEPDEGRDLNADGDMDDIVLVVHDLATGTNRSLGLATRSDEAGLTAEGRGVVLVSEEAQGRDLNADGDLLDDVAHDLHMR